MKIDLNSIEMTLLFPLWGRAKLSREHNPLLNDIKAIELVEQIDHDFSTFDRIPFQTSTALHVNVDDTADLACNLVYVARAKQFDDKIQAYITEHPRASIVNIGAGLDTTFYRVDNGTIHWYDLDLPAVIDVRKQLLPEPDRVTYIAGSLLDPSWCDDIEHTEDGVFMVAGGVLPYFEELEVKHFFSSLADNLPGTEIVFDVTSKLSALTGNLNLWKMGIEGVHIKWTVNDANDMTQWDTRVRVIEQFPYFRGIPRDPVWGEEIKIWMDFMDEIKISNIFHVSV
jgi:O-methyltransferase involved in polyketide biosynthesis